MILALAGRIENIPDNKPFDQRFYITSYFKKVFDQMDSDIFLFPIICEKTIDKMADFCDGLIVPGSTTDVLPSYYNEAPHPDKVYDYDEFKFDAAIIKAFADRKKPILGICGGLQSINVYFGGSLHQKISDHNADGLTHKIHIEEGSFLHKTYGSTEMLINSYHNQAVKDAAPDFKVIATSEDGIIEAIEKDNIVGVQWHPEVMNDLDFFNSFINMYFKK